MRVPLSWLREMVAIPSGEGGRDVAARLIAAGLEVETVEQVGGDVDGVIVVGLVQSIEELTGFKKPIRWCQVDVGAAHGGVRGIICGARNFSEGDLVVVALPGTVLPGGFTIAARETYGHVSDGMICSERELAMGEDHSGIIVLPADSFAPGTSGFEVLGLGDEILDIAVTPDRGYAMSVRGIAREVATSYGLAFDDPGLALVDLPAPAADATPWPCGSDDLDVCDLFTARTIVGFDPAASTPMWMRRRLVACGMRSVSLAVDVTNYVMLELGQPLHAFDMKLLKGTLRAGRATVGETLETLDHVVRHLDGGDLVIRDDRGPIGLAGLMGGLETEISDVTTDIVLESAHFTSEAIARSSRRHRLSSEASRRFERGVDRVLAPYASARAVALLLELGGGRYVGMTAVEAALEPTMIVIDDQLPTRVAGMPVSADTTVSLLRSVGCEVAVAGSTLSVTPPTWRPDLTDPFDLVEEVVRLVGYEHLPSTLPAARPGFGLTVAQRLRRRVGLVLAGCGGVEVLCYPFVGDAELDALQIPAHDVRRCGTVLANPLSDEQPRMAATLLPGLVAAARRNISRGSDDLVLFEIAPVFRDRAGRGGVVGGGAGAGSSGAGSPGGAVPRPPVDRRPTTEQVAELEALLPDQPLHLAAVLTGDRERAGWWGPARAAGWSDAIELARAVADAVGVDLVVRPGSDAPFHPGRTAELVVDGAVIGHAGELHPRAVEACGLPARAAALELDLDALLRAATPVAHAPRVGTFPVAKEDVALVVAASVPAADVAAALREGAGELLESLALFDDYTGPQVGQGKRSLAFALRFRAPDRTLSADEIAAARDAAVAMASARVGATLRS